MAVIQHPLVGAQNLDDPDYVIPPGQHKEARNIIFRGNKGNMRAESQVGTTLLVNPFLPVTGVNKEIGNFYDAVNKRIFFFNYNSAANHGIYIYNTFSGIFQRLIQSGVNTDGDILNFTADMYITSIDIIYGDGISGDILCFVDSLLRPTKINIQRYLASTYLPVERNYIDVAKAPPQMPPKCVYENDTTLGFNKTNKKLFQFRYRYVYDDYEKSVWGSASIMPLPNELSIKPAVVDVTKNARIALYFSTGGRDVIKIELAVRVFQESGTTAWQLFDSLDKTLLSITDNTIYRYLFFNNSTLIPLDPKEEALLYDWVPLEANCQSLLDGSTLAYSGIKEGYDLVLSNQAIISTVNGQVNNKLDASTTGGQTNTGSFAVQFANFTFGSGFVSSGGGTVFTYTGPTFTGKITIHLTGTIFATVFGASEGSISLNNTGIGVVAKVDLPVSTSPFTAFNLTIDYNPTTIFNGDIFTVTAFIGNGDQMQINASGTISVEQIVYDTEVFADANGVLFFGEINGIDSGVNGNQITFYFTGTGLNDGLGNPTTFDSPYINTSTSFANVNILNGVTPIVVSIPLVASIPVNIAALNAALVAFGFTLVSATTNTLTMSFPTSVKLLSSGVKINYPAIDGTTPFLSYINRSSEYFGVQYFDDKGRTNGVITNDSMKVSFPISPFSSFFSVAPSWAQIQIKQRPPLWASYYQVVRSNDLTFSKILYWVGNSAFADGNLVTAQEYAYIGIDNIIDYNKSIQSTDGVVGYEFSQGDRISIYGKYSSQGVVNDFAPVLYDYEIVGTSQDPVINGIAKIGNFVKIAYPSADIGANIKFDASNVDYQWYKIILYGLSATVAANQTSFYEFGKCFGIGNVGTVNAYHIGLEQTQSADLITPALVSIINGDYFFRQRDVIVSTPFQRPTNDNGYSSRYNCPTVASVTTQVITPNYIIGWIDGNSFAGLTFGSNPQFTSGDTGLFQNLTLAHNYKVRVQGGITVFSDGGATSVDVYLKIVTASTAQSILVVQPQLLTDKITYTIKIDATVTVPPLSKLYIITGNTMGVTNVKIPQFNLEVDVIEDFIIPVFDASFSDLQTEVGNSNGRPDVIDINAKQTYFDTLFRFSDAYILGTNINNSNRFYPNNFDEFDKSYGDVQRMIVNGRQLKIFQNRKCGVTNVYGKIIKNQTGSPTLITTDEIINKNNIQYYEGDFGIGTQRTAVCHNGYQFYFMDEVKGYICRGSLSGVEPISELNKAQSWTGVKLQKYNKDYTYAYGGNAKLIAAYNFLPDRDGEALLMTQSGVNGSETLVPETISFVERTNFFPGFYDFAPDNMICAENTLYSWVNGVMYIHNNTSTVCNYYGVQFKPSITMVFNDFNEVKKSWQSVAINSNLVWNCPTIYTQLFSYLNVSQQSKLIDQNFRLLEGEYNAVFLRDQNSRKGLLNGDFLKGSFIVIKFTVTDGSKSVFLIAPSVKFIISQLVNK